MSRANHPLVQNPHCTMCPCSVHIDESDDYVSFFTNTTTGTPATRIIMTWEHIRVECRPVREIGPLNPSVNLLGNAIQMMKDDILWDLVDKALLLTQWVFQLNILTLQTILTYLSKMKRMKNFSILNLLFLRCQHPRYQHLHMMILSQPQAWPS